MEKLAEKTVRAPPTEQPPNPFEKERSPAFARERGGGDHLGLGEERKSKRRDQKVGNKDKSRWKGKSWEGRRLIAQEEAPGGSWEEGL